MVIPLDQRHIEILGVLLDSSQPLSAKDIARKLEMTPRVVRYLLNPLGEWLECHHVKLLRQPGVGILITAERSVRESLKAELRLGQVLAAHYSSAERLHIILFDLLVHEGVSAVKQFQYQLGVARNTILSDMQKASVWLEGYNIHLVKRQNFGCFVGGSEANIRQAIVAVFIEAFGEVELLSIYSDLGNLSECKVLRHGNRNLFIDYLKLLQLKFYDNLINQIQEMNHRIFTDRGRMILALQLAVSIERLGKRHTVDIPTSEIEMMRLDTEFHLSATIGEKIRRHFHLGVPEAETAYLMLRIKEAEVRRQIVHPMLVQEVNQAGYQKINSIVDTLLGYVALYLHPALRLDQELKNNLIAHFMNLMDSQLLSSSEKADPLLEEMKHVYPETYKVTLDSVMEVNRKLEIFITDEEVGYITMHLVAAMERLRMRSRLKKKVIIICNAGGATSQLLGSRVTTEFPEVEIDGVFSYLNYKSQNSARDYDFIITTIPIPPGNKPSVFVRPLLDRDDVSAIRSVLDTLEHRGLKNDGPEPAHQTRASLADLLTRDTIELQGIARTWEDLVSKAGDLLLNVDAVVPSYIDAMKSVREEYGPYMVIMPGLALLHAFPGDGVNRLCMSMVTLETPVDFGHPEFDPVYLAFALGAVDNQSHLRALSELIEMVKSPGTITALCSTAIKSRALNIIGRFSQKTVIGPNL